MPRYLTRLVRDHHTGDIVLHVLDDSMKIEVNEGAEFVTVDTEVDLRARP